MVEETRHRAGASPCPEKSSPSCSRCIARAISRRAKALCRRILDYQGRGHSVGIHTRRPERARELADELDVVRVLVNQAHTFGNGGGFDNGLPFTLSMGCGTWAGNSISENLSCAISSTSPIW